MEDNIQQQYAATIDNLVPKIQPVGVPPPQQNILRASSPQALIQGDNFLNE
jgi:hypothetical protein